MLDSAEAVIGSKLDDGENLVWSGKPRQGLLLQPVDAALIPFSLMWGGFACYWEYEVVTTHQFWVLQLWGIPFVVLGLFLMVGRFFADAAVRARTYYGLTDRRIIIATGANTQSVSLSDVNGVTLSKRGDRSGTLVFGVPGTPAPTSSVAFMGQTRINYPRFTMIEDAQSVYDQIQAQRNVPKDAVPES